jgi:crotonobetainyl-CoA:carnitine CoA-transferase CaiB-like acyl-CoA transferase
MPSALSHIRVLDLSRIFAGPWATQNLGGMGADVVKVERPGVGDDTRGWGPPFLKDRDGKDTANAGYFLSVNRSKRSITVDLSLPAGQDIVRRLAALSDVVVENYKVGTLAKYGLDYRQLSEVNPRLVYCSITGFGQSGPYAHLPGYDYIFQGMGGLMSVTGKPDDEPGGGPVKVGVAIADILTGMYATSAILAALEHRNVSGRGQHIDLALLDCTVALSSFQALNYFMTGKAPVRMGNAHPNMVPYSVFACADGHLILAIGNDAQFARFCQASGRSELAADPRFVTVSQRLRHRAELIPIVSEILATKSTQRWMQILEEANVPCGPIYTMSQVFEDPQVQHRGMELKLPHAVAGEVPGLANPIHFSETPIRYREGPPDLGQNTEEVLTEVLSLDPVEISRLRSLNAI